MNNNILTLADSYKYSHAKQYPSMVSMYDYMESRGGQYPATMWVGLNYYLKQYLKVMPTLAEVDKAAARASAHGVPFDYEGWQHIAKLGYFPVTIKSIPEGSLVPVRNVLLTIESTDSAVPWAAGFLETLLMKVWYPTTVATKSYYVKKMLEKYGSPEWAQFAYHNFGDRGSSSVESAAIGGFAHLTQFMGTDNFNSLDFCEEFYGAELAGYSVFATEHSTTTAHGRDGEENFVYTKLLENPEAPIMSFVADSYDVYNFTEFCTAKGSRIRELVESRPHQKLVLRPDSGDAIEVITRMLSIMSNNRIEGWNSGPGALFTDFAILWGDGITPQTIELILGLTGTSGYAAENFVFGSGGDLMQNVNRDTQRFAIKCSSITVERPDIALLTNPPQKVYEQIDVYKDPITAPGKKSKKGKVTTWFNTETKEYSTSLISQQPSPHHINALQTVFENGQLIINPSLEGIRSRAN